MSVCRMTLYHLHRKFHQLIGQVTQLMPQLPPWQAWTATPYDIPLLLPLWLPTESRYDRRPIAGYCSSGMGRLGNYPLPNGPDTPIPDKQNPADRRPRAVTGRRQQGLIRRLVRLSRSESHNRDCLEWLSGMQSGLKALTALANHLGPRLDRGRIFFALFPRCR